MPPKNAVKGLITAVGAFTIWGLAVLFWREFGTVAMHDLLLLRIFASALLLMVVMTLFKQLSSVFRILMQPKYCLLYSAVACLLASNWLIFLYSAVQGYGLEIAMGYFLAPMGNMLAGHFIFKEAMNFWRKIGTLFAGLAILTMIVSSQGDLIVWIPLALGGAWTAYGFLRRIGPLNSWQGTLSELWFMSLIAVPMVFFIDDLHPFTTLWHYTPYQKFLTFCAALVTLTPLLLYNYAARNLTFISLGWLQYIAPILQFLVGYFILKNTLDYSTTLAFAFLWIGILIVALDSSLTWRKPR